MVNPDIRAEIQAMLGHVPSFIEEMPPQVQEAFWGVQRDLQLSDETAIPPKYKELIGLGVAAATKCPYCLHFHTEAAKLHGATDEELNEASALAMLFAGASTYLHGRQTDLTRFRKEVDQIVDHVREQSTAPA